MSNITINRLLKNAKENAWETIDTKALDAFLVANEIESVINSQDIILAKLLEVSKYTMELILIPIVISNHLGYFQLKGAKKDNVRYIPDIEEEKEINLKKDVLKSILGRADYIREELEVSIKNQTPLIKYILKYLCIHTFKSANGDDLIYQDKILSIKVKPVILTKKPATIEVQDKAVSKQINNISSKYFVLHPTLNLYISQNRSLLNLLEYFELREEITEKVRIEKETKKVMFPYNKLLNAIFGSVIAYSALGMLLYFLLPSYNVSQFSVMSIFFAIFAIIGIKFYHKGLKDSYNEELESIQPYLDNQIGILPNFQDNGIRLIIGEYLKRHSNIASMYFMEHFMRWAVYLKKYDLNARELFISLNNDELGENSDVKYPDNPFYSLSSGELDKNKFFNMIKEDDVRKIIHSKLSAHNLDSAANYAYFILLLNTIKKFNLNMDEIKLSVILSEISKTQNVDFSKYILELIQIESKFLSKEKINKNEGSFLLDLMNIPIFNNPDIYSNPNNKEEIPQIIEDSISVDNIPEDYDEYENESESSESSEKDNEKDENFALDEFSDLYDDEFFKSEMDTILGGNEDEYESFMNPE